MRLLFTGCGRSGTGYVAKLITEAGLVCGHEWAFNPFRAGYWGSFEAESSCLALRAVEDGMINYDCLVVHLIRNPLAVIRSVIGVGLLDQNPPRYKAKYTAWLCANTPQCFAPHLSPVTRAALYWLFVNQRAENCIDYRLRVEDINELDLREISEIIGKPLDATALDRVSKNTNGGQRDDSITWEDVLASLNPTQRRHFESMAERYGYAHHLATA